MNAEKPYKKEVPRAVRAPEQPILEPRQGTDFWWERNGIFNPGVAEYHNKILLLYRAYDDFRISRLGLAHSEDGEHFTALPHPIIDTDPTDPHERLGIEDPRITHMDGTYYIIHTSASYHRIGEESDVRGIGEHIPWRVRVGMHTTTDFHSFKHWGVILPDFPAKNASLLPAKFNDRFALYYRELTDEGETLKLSYTPDFKEWSEPQTILWPEKLPWHNFKVGTGSQAMLTNDGFLMVYHAIDEKKAYRLGLILFDRHDPAKIIWYSDFILEPEMPYELEGYVPNVVYTCGALIRGTELWIYYGAADRVIGRAVLPLNGVITL
jgi:predicted GH43/DUF377 family glycosyl hydrolase